MAASPLHDEIATLSANRGAVVLSAGLLSSLLLSRMQGAARGAKGMEVDTKNKLVTAEFLGLALDPTDLKISLDISGSDVFLRVKPDFSFTVRLFFKGDKTKTFSRIIFTVTDLTIGISGTGSALTFQVHPDHVTADFEGGGDADRSEAIQASKISETDLLRVEGLFAYGTADRVINSAFGALQTVELTKLFPHLVFSGSLTLKLTTTKECLLVIPESLSIAPFTGCPRGDSTRGVTITPQAPVKDSLSFEVNSPVQGVAPQKANQGMPLAALFAPKPLLDQRFTDLIPALTHYDEGTGFIGHVLRLAVEIRRMTVGIESGALKLTLGMAVWGRATLNVDVPCFGRKDFASLEVSLPENHGEAVIEVLLRLGVDSSARAIVTSEVVGINLGKADVKLDVFGGLVGMSSGALWGYILDFIIGRAIQNNLPWMVFDRIQAALDDKFTVVADLKDYLPFLKSRPNAAMFSGSDDSALLGLNVDG